MTGRAGGLPRRAFFCQGAVPFSIYAGIARPIMAYTGSVTVTWTDPGPLASTHGSWDAVKAIYRH